VEKGPVGVAGSLHSQPNAHAGHNAHVSVQVCPAHAHTQPQGNQKMLHTDTKDTLTYIQFSAQSRRLNGSNKGQTEAPDNSFLIARTWTALRK